MIMQDNIQFGTTRIDYDIVYSGKRKNATLAVYPMKQVEIVVPRNLEREHIQRLVRKKAGWITKQIHWFDEIAKIDSEKEYVNGETYLYLGRQYRLKITPSDGRAQAEIVGKNLRVMLPNKTSKKQINRTVKAAVWHWYRKYTETKVGEVVKNYSRKLGIQPPPYLIKNQIKRWGSCTAKKQLIFNFRIAMAPVSQIEYVIAHELCHVKIRDHSPTYWALLRRIMPDYEKRKEALRKEGRQYVL